MFASSGIAPRASDLRLSGGDIAFPAEFWCSLDAVDAVQRGRELFSDETDSIVVRRWLEAAEQRRGAVVAPDSRSASGPPDPVRVFKYSALLQLQDMVSGSLGGPSAQMGHLTRPMGLEKLKLVLGEDLSERVHEVIG